LRDEVRREFKVEVCSLHGRREHCSFEGRDLG
jgi:hypothetical protein